MAELNLNEVNELLATSEVHDRYYPYFSSAASSIRPKVNNYCDLDTRTRIRRLFIEQEFTGEIDEDLVPEITDFILYDKIPQEEKNKVSEHLTEDMKEYIFERFLTTSVFSKCKGTQGDRAGEVLFVYTPKVNGVPLKKCAENQYGLAYEEIKITFDRIKEIFINKEKPDTNELLAIRSILNSNDYFNMPWCPKRIQDIKDNLNMQDWVDYQDNLLEENDRLLKKNVSNAPEIEHPTHVNNELKDSIVSTMPSNYNTLEKAIYIYSKLCQLLSYDPLYYINNKDEREVANIENYNLDNNEVVCYEFAYILSDMLRSIGGTNIKEQKLKGDKFVNTHANLTFMIDDMVIFADSTRTIYDGDLTSSKYSYNMSGIRCELYDKDAQEKFKQAKDKVMGRLVEEDHSIEDMLPNKDQIDGLDMKDKLIMFNNMITSTKLEHTDFIAYARRLLLTMGLDMEMHLYYDQNTPNRFIVKFEYKCQVFKDGEKQNMDFFIDTSTKQIFDVVDESLEYVEANVGSDKRTKK